MSCSYPLIQPNPSGGNGGGSGTVTSVGLSLPAIFTVTGSPVTTTGTLTGTLATQTAGKIFAAPPTSTGTPTFQQMVAEHLNSTYSNGQVLTTNGAGVLSWATAGGSGTVTSVGLSLPSELTVTGSPVTTSGTLTGTWADQNQNLIFAAPAGGTGTPSFQQIVANHLNGTFANTNILQTDGAGVISWVAKPTGTVTSVALSLPAIFTVSGSPVTTTGTLTGTLATQTAGKIFAAPPTSTGTPTFQQIVAEHLNSTYSNGQYLTTNGSGVLSWATVSSSSPGGSTTNIQFNNAGAFGGSSDFIFNNTTKQVSITQTITGAATSSCLFLGRINPTATSNAALVVSGTNENSSTSLFQIQITSGIYSNFFANGKIAFRNSSATALPTLGIVELPWISGDTLPTLYVGGTSANITAIKAETNTNSYGAILANNTATNGQAIIANADYAIYAASTANGAAIWGEVGTSAYAGRFKTNSSGQTRTQTLVGIDTRGASGSGLYALLIEDTQNSLNFLTSDYTGKTSVRNGLATDNKMVDVGGVYYTSTTNASNTSTTETDLSNATLGANILGTDGDRIEVEGSFTTVNNGNAKTIKFYFGGFSFTYDASTDAANKLVMKFTVIRTGSSAQKIYGVINETTVSGSVCVSSDTVALTSSVVVKFTGQGGASNDITETTFTIKYYPKGGA